MATAKQFEQTGKIRRKIGSIQERQDDLRERYLSLGEELAEREAVRHFLKAKPMTSDRSIASIIGCSPKLVNELRLEMVACGEIPKSEISEDEVDDS